MYRSRVQESLQAPSLGQIQCQKKGTDFVRTYECTKKISTNHSLRTKIQYIRIWYGITYEIRMLYQIRTLYNTFVQEFLRTLYNIISSYRNFFVHYTISYRNFFVQEFLHTLHNIISSYHNHSYYNPLYSNFFIQLLLRPLAIWGNFRGFGSLSRQLISNYCLPPNYSPNQQ